MSYNGSGVFTRLYSWVDDRDNGIKMRADRMDAEHDGIATALSTAILKDGTQTVTADIPWNGNKITGLGDPTSAQDAATKAYIDTNFQPLNSSLTALAAVTDVSHLTDIGDLTLADGDIFYVSGGAITNLAKGTDSQVLTLSSGLPSWADSSGGGWTLLNETTVSVSAAEVEWDNTVLTADYEEFMVVVWDAQHDNVSSAGVALEFSFDNGSNYSSQMNCTGNAASSNYFFFRAYFGRENSVLAAHSGASESSAAGTVAATRPEFNTSGVNRSLLLPDGEVIDAVRVVADSSGNITAGTFQIWGR